MKASEFDRKFDDGQNIVANLDVTQARRPDKETGHIGEKHQRRVNSLSANTEKLAALEESPMSDAELEQEIAAARKARR